MNLSRVLNILEDNASYQKLTHLSLRACYLIICSVSVHSKEKLKTSTNTTNKAKSFLFKFDNSHIIVITRFVTRALTKMTFRADVYIN